MLDVPEITQKDFLALPEPIQEGDWVSLLTEGKDNLKLFKVAKIEMYPECIMNDVVYRNSLGIGYPDDVLNKLTPDLAEQLSKIGV